MIEHLCLVWLEVLQRLHKCCYSVCFVHYGTLIDFGGFVGRDCDWLKQVIQEFCLMSWNVIM